MADETCMPTRRKRKVNAKKLINNPPKIKSSKFTDDEWKSVGGNDELFSFSGGLEEITSYNEEDLQAFVSSSSKKKKRKHVEIEDSDSKNEDTLNTEHNVLNIDASQKHVNVQTICAEEEKDPENLVSSSNIKKMSRKERKKLERKEYRLKKLKARQTQWRLKKKQEKKAKKEEDLSRKIESDLLLFPSEENINVPSDEGQATLEEEEEKEGGLELLNENWAGLGIPNEILKSLATLKFSSPTEIQKKCLPHAILNHKDVLGAAETGSGKTLAFGIPVVTNIMQIKKRQVEKNKKSTSLKALVITPTRELALQIQEHLKTIAKHTDVTSCVVVGGLAPEKQQRLLNKLPDILIATPGRLLQLVSTGHNHLSQLNKLKFLVIDECDRLFEHGHFKDLNEILERINDDDGKTTRQNLIFSATLTLQQQSSKTKTSGDFQSLFKKVGLSPRAVTVDLTQKHVTTSTLMQMKVMCNNDEKESYLMYFLLHHRGRTILFTNTISETKKLCAILDILKQSPLQLHAGKQQKQRLKCLERFKSRADGLLVCTDVAARGLDIPDVENVVHFRLPKDPKVYVHRSGRTARAKKDGLSLILEGPEDFNSYKKISNFLKLDSELPQMSIDRGIFDAISERVRLAKEIEKLTFRSRKESSDNSWINRVSKAMDIAKDEVESNEDRREKLLIKQKQNELNKLLKMKLFSSQFSGNYPTRNGNIVTPSILPLK